MTDDPDADDIVEQRCRRAQEIAAEQSEAMVEGYKHLFGSEAERAEEEEEKDDNDG